MLRQGLDPERVDWLALTNGPVSTCSNTPILISLSTLFLMVVALLPVKLCGWVFLLSHWRALIMSVV